MTLLSSQVSTNSRPCMAQDRFGRLVVVDGEFRGKTWDGIKSAADLLGIDAPSSAPTVAASSTAGSVSFDASATDTHLCAYRYLEIRDYLDVPIYSNLSTTATYNPANANRINWTALVASSQSRVTHIELFRAVMADEANFYRVIRLGALGTATAIATVGDTYVVTCTAHGLAAGAQVTFGSVTAGTGNVNTDFHNKTLVITSVTTDTFTIAEADTTSGNASGALATTATWTTVGFRTTAAGVGGDSYSDTQLEDDTASYFEHLPVTTDDEQLNAYRFVPPVNFMSVVALFQDRAWFAAPIRLSASAATLVQGSATVDSVTGLTCTSALAGRVMIRDGDTRAYKISSVTDSNTFVLTEQYQGANGTPAITILPEMQEFTNLYFSEIDEVESGSSLNVVPVQQNKLDRDEIVGLIPHGMVMYILMRRHTYVLEYVQQPLLDANVRPYNDRGAFSNFAWCSFEGRVYIADTFGMWYIGLDGGWDHISGPIQDIWRDGVILDETDNLSVQADPVERAIIVSYQDDDDEYEAANRWLKYFVDDNKWATGFGAMPIGAMCVANVEGQQRLIQGSLSDKFMVASEGTADNMATAYRATITVLPAGDQIRFAYSDALAADTWKYANIGIICKNGTQHIDRLISSHTSQSGGVVTITADNSYSPALAVGDTVIIGGITCKYRSKDMSFVEDRADQHGKKMETTKERRVAVYHQPTTNEAEIFVRSFYDYDTTAYTYPSPTNFNQGVEAIEGTPDLKLSLKSTRSTEGTDRGQKEFGFAGKLPMGGTQGHRVVALELRAVQGLDQIIIDEISVDGVE